jgi:hypothetical protein
LYLEASVFDCFPLLYTLKMDNIFVTAFLEVFAETFEGGKPGAGTAYLDNTAADGSGNAGFFALLEGLSAEAASKPTALGKSIAAHMTHSIVHIEMVLKFAAGDRPSVDWQASFLPETVSSGEWVAQRQRLQQAYRAMVQLAHNTPTWNAESAGGMMASLAHAAYHLGAVRQILKLARV